MIIIKAIRKEILPGMVIDHHLEGKSRKELVESIKKRVELLKRRKLI